MSYNVGQILRQGALRHPDRVAVVDHGGDAPRFVSYARLDAQARAVAARVSRARGADGPAAVALMAQNSAELIAAWFGIAYAGAAVVPIPATSTTAEVAARVRHAGCQAILHDDASAPTVAAAAGGLPRWMLEEDGEAPPGGQVASRAPADRAMILQTSGTTGRPKGVVISHASLLLHTALLAQHTLRLTPDDRVLAVLPITHSYGCRMAMLAPLFAGASIEVVPRFSARGTLALIAERALTWVPAVPTMYAAWAAARTPARPTSVRWCLSAGAPLPATIRAAAEQRLGASVREGYGLTEATFSTIDAPPSPPVRGSVGRPVWGVEVRIVDDAGATRHVGAKGHILLRGQNVMQGYLDDAAATGEVLIDGWLRTGDLGHVDPSGRLFVTGRSKDLILHGGHSVYPAEVEAALVAHPAILEAAVIGQPDPFYGEVVVAVVVAASGALPDPGAVSALCAGLLSPHKRPRALAIVDSLPLGPSGKVLKRDLRRMLTAGELPLQRLSGG